MSIKRKTIVILCLCCVLLAITAKSLIAATPDAGVGKLLYASPYEFGHCITAIAPNEIDKGVIIQDEQTLKASLWNSPDCQASKVLQVDFSEHTLIGRRFQIPGGCSDGRTGFTVSVFQDNHRRVYTHTITSGRGNHSGVCAGQSTHQIWLLLPKLPTNYQVEFQRVHQPNLIITCDFEYL